MPRPGCPDTDRLSAYVLGKLSDEAAERLSKHTATCPQCQAALQRLDALADPLIARVRAPRQPQDSPEPALQRFLHCAEAIAMQPAPPASGAQVVPVQQFLQCLSDSALLSADEIKSAIGAVPPVQRQDTKQLAQELMKQGKLTRYQATMLCVGKSKGLVVERYVILDKIGAGGMGMVFKAKQKGMGRTVALKVLAPAVAKNPASVQRFQREVRVAAQLEHPNIVRTFDASQSDGMFFLVMEFVDGADLSSRIKQHGPLPPGQAVECVLQAARGLANAHEQGIVHRDIKPHNLLLDSKGAVKVLDMGLARMEEGSNVVGSVGDITETGNIMGTCDYMAPEQAINTKKADQRADIYSLGCTLYWLLAGKPMYAGETQMEKLMAHQHDPVPQLPGASKKLQAVFQKMVAKKPDGRYQTMREVIADLEKCGPAPLQDVGITTQPARNTGLKLPASELSETVTHAPREGTETEMRRERKRAGRRWIVVGGGMVVALALLGGALALLGGKKPPSNSDKPPDVITDITKLSPGSIAARSGPMREELLCLGGGNRQSEEAVARGLKWIAGQQKADGSWIIVRDDPKGARDLVGATALALLPLLGAGIDFQNAVYRKNTERGISFLISQQKDDGGFGENMYAQGLATIALCEGYLLAKEERTRQAAQKAVNYIVKAQHSGGGWRYQPGDPGDTSVTGWNFLAFQAARMAGLDVPQDAITKVSTFLNSVALPDGSYRYLPKPPTQADGPVGATTAIGLLCRLYLGWEAGRAENMKSAGFLKDIPPLLNAYRNYYVTQALYHVGGQDWHTWNAKIRDHVLGKQEADGSWSPEGDTYGKTGGRLMTTSFSLLTLEVYYRYVPFCVGKMKPTVASREVDLLKLVSVPKPTPFDWRFEGPALVSPGVGLPSRVPIRYEPPDEYTLTLVTERVSGNNGLFVYLVRGGTRFHVEFDTFASQASGLGMLDGKWGRDNETAYRKPLLPTGKPRTIVCTVRKTGVTVTCDDQTIVSWQGDYRRLSNPDLTGRDLYLGSYESSFRFTKITLTPLTVSTIAKATLPLNITPAQTEVFVDNVLVNFVAPKEVQLELEPGQHEIKVTKNGYRPFVCNVDIMPGANPPIQVNLERVQ